MLTKEEIRDRLHTDSVWITTTRTALTAAVAEDKMRYIVMVYINGDQDKKRGVEITKLEEDGTTYTVKFSHINVPPAGNVQVPEGAYDPESPILVCEGGTRPYGKVSGNSVNLTVVYWDNDI